MKMKPLTAFCALNMGQSPSSETYNEENVGLPFFQGNADFGEVHPKVRIWCSSPVKVAAAGDILISVRAPIGAMNIANAPCCIGRGLAALSPNPDTCVQEYLYYALQSRIDSLIAQGTGSTFKAIGKKTLEDTQIPAYSLDEQQIISDTLSETNQLITKAKAQVSLLDQLVKSRFVEMFGDCVINQKHWKTRFLEEIAEVGSSKRVFVEELQETGIPFYRGTEVGALAEGKSIDPELFITEEHYNKLCEATGKPQIGDLLMPSICPDGRIWVVNTEKPFYFKDGRVLWVHSISSGYNPVFLLYTLKDRIMSDYNSIASGTTFSELKIFALKKCRIFEVPLELQNRFAAFVAEVDKSKFSLKNGRKEACFAVKYIWESLCRGILI